MNIVGKNIQLRAIEREDLPALQKWANDPDIQLQLGGWHFPTSLKDQGEWYSTLSCNSINQRFAIEAKELGIIGTANLVSIDWKNRNAFHGMLIGDKDLRGKGYGFDVVMSIMRYAFDELGLVRLDTDIIEYNKLSLKLYVERCGWVIEGRRPNWYFRQGRYWEKIIVGVTRERYEQFISASRHSQ